MKFYFKGSHKKIKGDKDGLGVCSFVIPEWGLLHRSIVFDKDIVLLDFMSLLLVFEFITQNPSFFEKINLFTVCGPKKILQYVNSDNKLPKKVEAFRNASNAYIAKIKQDMRTQINFLDISEKEKQSFFSIDSLKVDKNLAKYLTLLSKEHNDTYKGR
jgi:hypothetical protein